MLYRLSPKKTMVRDKVPYMLIFLLKGILIGSVLIGFSF